MKKIASNTKKNPFRKFGEQLKQLCCDFIDETAVTVESNLFRMLADMKSISSDVKQVNKDVKDHGG